jgi:hypothetical protein
MTQYPGFPPPADPSLGYAPRPPRPTTVTVMSILAMVFGGLFTFCNAFAAVMALVAVAMGGAMKVSPMFSNQQVKLSPSITAYNAIVQIIWLVLSITLLMIGIGGMTLKPWARRVALGWAGIAIIFAAIQTVLSITWVTPASMEALRKTQPGNPMLQHGNGIVSVTQIIILVLACILPVLFLILWRRPEVKMAFGEGDPMSK